MREGVEVAVGGGLEAPQPAALHHHAVLPPERDDGQVVRSAALDARVDGAPPLDVEHPPPALRQPIHDRARVAPSVVARGRAHGRMEGQIVEVGIADADPGEGAELEVAAPDVGEERAPLVGAHLEGDPDLGERGLDRLGESASLGLVRGLVDEPEAGQGPGAVGIRVAGALEKPPRPCRVVAVGARRGVRPVLGRQEPARRPRRAAENEAHDRVPVEGERDRLAHPALGEARIAEVERQVIEAAPGAPPDDQVREAREPVHHLRLGRILDQLDPAALQLEHPHHLVGYDAHDERIEPGWAAGVARVRLEHDPLPSLGPDDTEGARSHGDLARVAGPGCGQDAEAGRVEEGREGLAQVHHDRRWVGRVDRGQHRKCRALRRGECGVEHGPVGRTHVVRLDPRAVGEVKVGAQAEHDRKRIAHFPRCGQLRPPPGRRVGPREGDMEQIGQAGVVGVHPEARVEAVRVALEREDEARRRHRRLAAGGGKHRGERREGCQAHSSIDSLPSRLIPCP